jgi:plastocyanin
MGEFRKRVSSPFIVPVGALVVIGLFVFAYSRVLLAVPKYWSVALAGLLAAEILGVGAILTAVRKVTGGQKVLVGLLGAIVLVGGGIGFANGIRPIDAHHAGVAIAATDSVFDTAEVAAPADAPFPIVFTNNDALPHNVAITSDGEAVFSGDLFTGPGSTTYEVPALNAGAYDFSCDVHPTMTGRLIAGDEGAHGGEPTGEPSPGEGGEHGAVTVTASGSAFDTDTITVAAGTESHLTLDNQDPQTPHNISVYTDDSASEQLFAGDLVTGPDTIDYVFTIEEPGEYFFRCDFHPDMNGALVAE